MSASKGRTILWNEPPDIPADSQRSSVFEVWSAICDVFIQPIVITTIIIISVVLAIISSAKWSRVTNFLGRQAAVHRQTAGLWYFFI